MLQIESRLDQKGAQAEEIARDRDSTFVSPERQTQVRREVRAATVCTAVCPMLAERWRGGSTEFTMIS